MTDTEAQPAATDPSPAQPTKAPIGAGPVSELPEDATEAAAKAMRRNWIGDDPDALSPTTWRDYERDARSALAAALPFLERALRAKIAAEIERTLWNFEEPFTRLPAMAAAARVARGGEA